MSTPLETTSRRTDRTGMLLRVIGALALGFSGILHAKMANDAPPLFQDGEVTLSGLFMAQAVAAVLVSLWVLVQGNRLAWLALGVVAAASLAALLLSTWVTIPSIGPLPEIHDPIWYTEKTLAAISAGIATLAAIAALSGSRRAV